ncbi:putative calcium-binding protein CML19 [Dichanthelium oligosanthes]|uniref:Putative calcium-binding protein CML19 n=1 Tax=Dichanthelium oligosanthes TaxID=888268 RepID=A0A1E5W9I7_9POAL|nr:putative calcium-binding protein CML19 [Dichanthelium oligosanthes]
MILNSSKLSTPSPSRSNLQIMARQSSISNPWCVPSLLSIRLRLVGVMHPSPSISYMRKACLSPWCRSSSPTSAWTRRANSSPSSSPSPSASTEATSASASSADTSSPSVARMHSRSSDAEILPSASLSNAANREPSSMVLNSSKLSTPSPSRSNLQIIAWHSAMSRCAPSLPSISFRLSGVTHPLPSISYIPNASLSHRRLSSSWSASASPASLTNSSSSSSPSPSASADAISALTSSADMSSPVAAFMQRRSSAAEILPSPSWSNDANTRLNSPDSATMVAFTT